MIEWRESNEQGEHFNQGKECDQPEKLELKPPEKKEMKNVKRGENSLVEIIEGRMKRHTNETDGRERLKLQEEKGWEGGKNKGNLERGTDE